MSDLSSWITPFLWCVMILFLIDAYLWISNLGKKAWKKLTFSLIWIILAIWIAYFASTIMYSESGEKKVAISAFRNSSTILSIPILLFLIYNLIAQLKTMISIRNKAKEAQRVIASADMNQYRKEENDGKRD